MYYSDMYLKKKLKKDKNGLIISWQIPTSSLENGPIFLPSFFQYECTEKDFRTAQDPVLQSFKLEFCIILIQLGEKTAKKTTTHTHTHKYTSHKKKQKKLETLFQVWKNMFGFCILHIWICFWKLVDIEIYLISVFCVLYTNVISFFFRCICNAYVVKEYTFSVCHHENLKKS